MPMSRERAVDVSRRIAERLRGAAGIELAQTEEFVRNRVLQLLLEWEKENEKLAAEARRKLAGRRVVEGSRDWDLRFAEEMERAYGTLLARGE